jgi:acetoacetyl-CoA synthetase
MSTPLWTPSPARVAASALTSFRHQAEKIAGKPLGGYEELHAWSIEQSPQFHRLVWDWAGAIGDPGERLVDQGSGDMASVRFLPDARFNVAENLLRRRGADDAIVAVDESGGRRTLSWDELRAKSAQFAGALRRLGVQPGDRVAVWLPNGPEAVIAMLGASSVGATFSSTSPDFGPAGVLDRFDQIEPVVLVATPGYTYNGQWYDCLGRLEEIKAGLPSLRATVVVGQDWDEFLASGADEPEQFEQLPSTHPWYILYSSGTTGVPKCIVHSTGGGLLQHLKEHRIHCDIRPGDRVLYFTTTGWMMWNWLVGALASEATIVLYDGSPFHPRAAALFDVAEREGVTLLGVSAKYIDALHKEGLRPRETHDLSSIRTICSTGSPLSEESFVYVYDAIAPDVHLASISGGTDLFGCFIAGDPTGSVWAGEMQRPALGMATDVFDAEGRSLRNQPGVRGELVCTAPFPTMPLGFWGDPDGSRYHKAYFDGFPGVWTHGDFASWTAHGGMQVHGRSDTTLNPGGVRIGTAEIYRVVEQVPEVLEALVFGQAWEDDVRIVLLVRLAEGVELTQALIDELRRRIRTGCTPRHVPRVVAAVSDLPRTRSGKLVELAVADAVNGRPVRNTEAIANPEAIDAIRGLPALQPVANLRS